MIFNTGDFYENLSISSKIGYNLTTNSGILREEVHTVGSSIKYFVARKHCEWNALLPVRGGPERFLLSAVTCKSTKIQIKGIVAFQWQQLLRKRAALIRYMYIACLVCHEGVSEPSAKRTIEILKREMTEGR